MLVEMKDICKDYPQGKETVRILKNINLQVEEGDYLAIMGPSGSGKTTLMNLLGCLDVPTSGEYLLTGENVTKANENHLAEIRNRLLAGPSWPSVPVVHLRGTLLRLGTPAEVRPR